MGKPNSLTEHGTARWLDKSEVKRIGLIDGEGITLGHMMGERWGAQEPLCDPVTYNGEAHLVTIAKNRSGKGTSAIIPNLLTYRGGVFCIDPKGENAIVTAHARRRMGQDVHILDPWKIALKRLEGECGFDGSDDDKPLFQAGSFNPLDMIAPDSIDLTDDAMRLAEALILESGGDSHWSTEATAALSGFIMHVITSPNEEGQRHLPRVRDIVSLAPKDFGNLLQNDMAQSHVPAVRNAANRLMSKTEKELASVMSTAAANTHFLDSPAIRSTLETSSFDFGALKDNDTPLTVFLVLPADRLNTHGRWLRLLVSMALTSVSRRVGKPKISALFILDEFAALGRLQMIEEAFGLMAGFGMRIWAILQDLSQLQDLYQNRWQTFLANAGAIQIFGINDSLTADYFSRYLGQETVEQISKTTAEIRGGGVFFSADPNYRSMRDRSFGRELMKSEELMKLPNETTILLISPHNPISAVKIPYYRDARFFDPDAMELRYTHHPDFNWNDRPNLIASGRFGRHLRDIGLGKVTKPRKKWGWSPLKIVAAVMLGAVSLWQWDQCGWDNTPPIEAQCFYKWGADAPPLWKAIQPWGQPFQ